jgi:hypothetical protein
MSDMASGETLDTASDESTSDSATEARHVALKRGSTISRYVLLSPIGHGVWA